MTSLEDLVRTTLAERAHDVDRVQLNAAPTRPARTRRWVAVGTVVAVAAAVLVAIVLVAPWRGGSDRNATPPADPAPPAGMQWVSYHGITLTVPDSWATGFFDCRRPDRSTVQIAPWSAPSCAADADPVVTPPGATVLYLSDLQLSAPVGDPTTVAGQPARRFVNDGGPGESVFTQVQLPAAGVQISITGPVGPADAVLAGLRYTPVDPYGCTAQQSARTDLTAPLDLTGARSVRVCEYAPKGDDSTPPWLMGSRLLSPAEVDTLRRTLATTEVVEASPSGVVGLPSFVASGSQASGAHVYRFELPDGSTHVVTVETGSRPVYVYGDGNIGKLPGTDGDAPVDLPGAFPR